MRVIPSIASGNLLEIGSELQRIQSLPRLHLDMEDGNFLPSMTFGMDMVRAIAGVWKGELDAHLKRGSLAVISGKLAKASPESVRFRTDSVTLGVRGTEFILEASSGQ